MCAVPIDEEDVVAVAVAVVVELLELEGEVDDADVGDVAVEVVEDVPVPVSVTDGEEAAGDVDAAVVGESPLPFVLPGVLVLVVAVADVEDVEAVGEADAATVDDAVEVDAVDDDVVAAVEVLLLGGDADIEVVAGSYSNTPRMSHKHSSDRAVSKSGFLFSRKIFL